MMRFRGIICRHTEHRNGGRGRLGSYDDERRGARAAGGSDDAGGKGDWREGRNLIKSLGSGASRRVIGDACSRRGIR